MQVKTIENQPVNFKSPGVRAASNNSSFALQLNRQQDSQKIDSLPAEKIAEPATIKLGSLSGNTHTVAQLLLASPDLKAQTWSIIHDPVNKQKAFDKIPAGKAIYFNPATRELQWSGQQVSISGNQLILGQLNKNSPTVSDLLSQQDNFKAQRWDIIHSDINRDKAFTRIPDGSTVYMDSRSREISWHSNKPGTAHLNAANTPLAIAQNSPVQKLDDAVKPYMGTDYKHLDCYTLIVNGLENMGIRYRGKDSLSSQLTARAQLDGRASNAYFTGEGLTEALGEKVYTRAITQVSDIARQTRDVFQEMKNLMQKGDILSFSLQTRGHTGVISQNNRQWTYINSGRLDHSINANAPRHGVGEESLLNEISNWIKLAQKRKEALQITVGRLDKKKFV